MANIIYKCSDKFQNRQHCWMMGHRQQTFNIMNMPNLGRSTSKSWKIKNHMWYSHLLITSTIHAIWSIPLSLPQPFIQTWSVFLNKSSLKFLFLNFNVHKISRIQYFVPRDTTLYNYTKIIIHFYWVSDGKFT